MKILQLCNKAPYPANDGSSIAISTLAEGLADNGIELHLLPINTKKHFKPEENIAAAFKQKTNYQSVYKNTDTSALGAFLNLFTSQSYFVSRFYFKEYEQLLIQKLQTNSFDIVQLEGVFMATYIPIIKKYSKAKIVLRSHNVEHHIWERHLVSEKNILKKTYLTIQNNRLKSFEINTFNKVDAIVTITDEDKKNISLICPKTPIHTCLTGVNLEEYKQVFQSKNPNTLFHFASMDWMPNIEAVDWLLNQVWNDVLKQQPQAKIILAGRGMPERIKKLASENIIVIDTIKDSTEFYNSYDIMLVPLWSGSGLRIKLVEGLAYGKAIITTSIGAEGIPYSTNKDLLIADTNTEFTKAIITLLSNLALKEDLQKSARTLAENHFNYKIIAKNLITFYNTF
jgi:glycosyltransferase involved in cell wall biosynthesis